MSIKRVFRQAVSFIMTFLMLLSYIPLSAEAAGTMSMKVKIDGTTYYDEEDCGEFDLNEDSYASIKLTYKNVGYATIQIHEAAGNTIGMRSDVGVINGTSTSTRQTKTVKVPFVANVADSGYTVNKELPVGDYAFWIFYKDKQSDSTAERILVYFSLVKNSSGSITLSKSSISLNWGGSNEDSFTVSGVSSYSVAIDSTGSQWLKYEKSGKTVTVRTRRANYSTSTRTATVTVTSGSNSKTVKVTQKACGEAAPTIVAKTGPSLSSLTTIPSGSNIGSYGTTGTDTFWLYAQVNHVRRITVNIKSKTTGEPYLSQTFDSSDGLDGSSQTVKCFTPVHQTGGAPLPVGKYYFEIWASNSPEKNDPWSQHPDCWVVYFDVIGEGEKDFSSFDEAEKMISYPKKMDWSKVGEINYVEQKWSTQDKYFYAGDNGYWTDREEAKGKCTRAASCMAISYMGITALPKNVNPTASPYATYAKNLGLTTHGNDNESKGSAYSISLSTFQEWYDRYAADTKGEYSPIILHTYTSSSMHAFAVFGRDVNDPDYYYVVDSGTGDHLGKVKIVEVSGKIRIGEYIKRDGSKSSNYNSNKTMLGVWQYEKTGTVAKVTITYNANGGRNAPSSTTAACNTTVTLSTKVPTRSGYVFKGWATSSSATMAQYQPGASYTVTGNVTLYAVWAKEQGDPGYDPAHDIPSLTGRHAEDIVAIARAQTGYLERGTNRTVFGVYTGTNGQSWCASFVSWCANEAGLTQKSVPESYLYVGKGGTKASPYSILKDYKYECWYFYEHNGSTKYLYNAPGSIVTDADRIHNGVGVSKRETLLTPQKGDLVFFRPTEGPDRWGHVGIVYNYKGGYIYYVDGNGTNEGGTLLKGKSGNKGVSEWKISINASLICAIARPDYNDNADVTVTITYNANGGKNAPASTTGKRYDTVTLSTKIPTRSGYVFIGWSTSSTASASSCYKAGSSYKLTENVTLYAVWEKEQVDKYTISGTITSAKQANNNVTVILCDEVGKNLSRIITTGGGYSFTVPKGSYMIRVTKANHVDRDYYITVKNTNVTQNVKICLLGDVNMDGKVNSTDYLWVQQYVSRRRFFDDYQKELADVNKKGGVNSTDVLWIKQRILHIRDEEYKLVK